MKRNILCSIILNLFPIYSLDPPEITIMPSSQEVKEGFGVTLVCNASGNPRPKITWTKQGSNTVLSTAETLSLNNLVREDDGSVYICNMQNNLGSQQANATIAMLCKYQFM